MRRWVLIIMLLIYPFQLALAVADQCCVATPAGITHHAADSGKGAALDAVGFVDDEARHALGDPHCPACVFGQITGLPATVAAVPALTHQVAAPGACVDLLPSVPRSRPERPNWPASAP